MTYRIGHSAYRRGVDVPIPGAEVTPMLKDRSDLLMALLVVLGIFVALWAAFRYMGIPLNLSFLGNG
jgi:hypothetical protein